VLRFDPARADQDRTAAADTRRVGVRRWSSVRLSAESSVQPKVRLDLTRHRPVTLLERGCVILQCSKRRPSCRCQGIRRGVPAVSLCLLCRARGEHLVEQHVQRPGVLESAHEGQVVGE